MPTKIKIEPNDQSWVGKKIKNSQWVNTQWVEVLYVGEYALFGKVSYKDPIATATPRWNSPEGSFFLEFKDSHWELYEEPEKECVTNEWVPKEWEIKCGKTSEQKEAEPFWLGVGDVIREKLFNKKRYKVLEINPETIHVEDLETKSHKIINKEEAISQIYKKIRLASPAVITQNTNPLRQLSNELFESLEEAKEYFKKFDKPIIWPARNQFGEEIWIDVTEEEKND